MDLIFPHNFLPCISMYHIHFHLLDGTCCFTTSGSGNETCIPELTLTQAGPAHSSPSAFFGGARGLRRRRILRTKTETSLRHKTSPLPPLPLQLWGSQHAQGNIYIYMNIMNIHWQYGRPLAGVPCSFGSGAVPKEPSCSTIFARDTAEKNSGFYFLTGEPESLELLVPSLVIPDIERISWEYAIQSWLVICAWLLELVLTNSTAELFKSIQGLQRARKRLASLKKIKTPAACRIWDLVKEVTCKWRLLTSNPNHEGNSNSVTQNPLTAAFSEQKINNWILVHQHSTAAIAFLTIPWFPPHSARGTRNCGATPRECSNSVCKVADARMPNFELWCLILAFYHS